MASIVLAALLLWSWAAQAAFVVEEYYDSGTNTGYLGVKNTEPTAVVAFAVANDTLTAVDGSHELYRVWAAALISETNWDLQKTLFEGVIGQPIPAFGTLFPGYEKAAIYWAHDILTPGEQAIVAGLSWEPGSLRLRDPVNQSSPAYFSQPIPSGDDATYSHLGLLGFYFYADAPASPFVALTQDFRLLQGETVLVAIPEPKAMFLMLAGLALLGVRSWRRA
ncbi:MAG: hypothetical protein IT531_13230 [Burkholderiales bacterium]|nr:hypothetical protein [Burkholderiales bacterium]